MELPFATGYYIDESQDLASVENTNVIPELYTIDGVKKSKLRAPPGIELFTTAGTKLSRGSWVLDEIAYEVAGNTLYRINSDRTNTDLGTIDGSGRVSMASSVLELCIVVPDVTGYIYSVAGGLTEITDATYLANLSLQVAFKDGYFLHVTTAKFFKSNLNDGLTYDALDFASAESLPDKITGVHVSRNQAYVPGVETIEKFQNIGGSGFPYQRVTGATIPMGVKAKFSLVDFAQTFVFVGGAKNDTPSVYLFTGSVPEKIATNAIDLIISDHTDTQLKDIFCTTYSERGGFFLNVHFKNRTMTYDRATGLWHERTSKDVNGQQTNWRVNNIISAYGKTLATDNQSGRVGEFDKDVYTEYGVSVKRVFSTIPFSNLGNRVSFSDLEVDMESGTGQLPYCESFNEANPDVTDSPDTGDTLPEIVSTADTLHRLRDNITGELSAQNSLTLGTFGVTKKYDVIPGENYTVSINGAPLGYIIYIVTNNVQCFNSDGSFNSNVVPSSTASRSVSFKVPDTANKVAFNIRNSSDFSNTNPVTSDDFDLCLDRVMLNKGLTALEFTEYTAPGLVNTSCFLASLTGEQKLIVKQGDFYYIRAKAQLSSIYDVVYKVLANKPLNREAINSRTGVVDFYGVRFINKLSADTVSAFNLSTDIQSSGIDESCPVRMNGMFVAGNHGVIGYKATMTGHGKTNVDIGSTWSDGTDTWVLYYIDDTDNATLVRLNTGTSDKWVISSADFSSTTLTHIAGATSTANIVMTVSVQAQNIPVIRNYAATVEVDSVEVLNNGIYVGDSVMISESYELLSIGSQQSYLIANVGSASPSYTDVAIDTQIEFSYVYEWDHFGSMSINTAHDVALPYTRSTSVDYFGAEQIQRLSLSTDTPPGMHDKAMVYVPEVAPVSGLDFESIADVTSNVLTVDVPRLSCDDSTDPASHFCLIGRDSADNTMSGQVFGYCRESGLGIPATRAASVETVYSLSPSEKNYPHAIDALAGDAVSTDLDTVIAFKAPFLPTDNDLTIPAVIVSMNGKDYCYITAHKNFTNKSVQVPDEFEGKAISVIKSHANVSVLNTSVINNSIQLTVINSYGDIIVTIG